MTGLRGAGPLFLPVPAPLYVVHCSFAAPDPQLFSDLRHRYPLGAPIVHVLRGKGIRFFGNLYVILPNCVIFAEKTTL